MNRALSVSVAILALSTGLLLLPDSGTSVDSKANLIAPLVNQADSAELPEVRHVAAPQDVQTQDATKHRAAEPFYVGKAACKECHPDNFQLHSKHGHSHTFANASNAKISDHFAGRTFDHGEYGTYAYVADNGGLAVTIPDRFGDQPFPLQFALGSGHNGYTLLSLMADAKNDTVAFEHRVSWFHEGDRLGPTPGQEHGTLESPADLFGQKHVGNVMRKCVYCHTTTGEIIDQQIVNLTPNVNCEKCHGPGSEHVKQARAVENPPPYAVGADDWNTESEIQLCGDCHRLPTNVSRKELREYPDSLTRFQPIGMLRSECYLASDGDFKCTTCHNPHTTLSATAQDAYVEKCVNCHLEQSASHVACPVSPKTGCIECHMPPVRLEDVGISFHDHWIRVHDEH